MSVNVFLFIRHCGELKWDTTTFLIHFVSVYVDFHCKFDTRAWTRNCLALPLMIHIICRCRKWPPPLRVAWFWRNWNTEKAYSKFAWDIFHTISSWHRFPQWKSTLLNCTTFSWPKEMYITLCFTSVTCGRLKWILWWSWCIVPHTCHWDSCSWL